jgi:flagellar biosynthesis protein FlhA
MEFTEALSTFTVLTIGDGLVTQIPALIISTSAGIMVSRAPATPPWASSSPSSSPCSPGHSTGRGIVFLFGLVPGLPICAFDPGNHHGRHSLCAAHPAKGGRGSGREKRPPWIPPPPPGPEQVEALLPLDTLELEVGYGLIPLVDEEQNGDLLERIRSIRQQLALETGLVVPPLHVRDNLQLKPGGYAILIKGNEVAVGEIDDRLHPGHGPWRRQKADGRASPPRSPPSTCPRSGFRRKRKEEAQFAGYSVVDLSTVIATHLTEVIKGHAGELLGRQEVQRLLDNLAKSSPKTVEELNGVLPLGQIQKVLQNLFKERVSIRDMLTIAKPWPTTRP